MQRLILEKDKALREEQQKLNLVIDGARDYAIFMVDAEGRIATWNAGAERLTQWKADEAIGRSLSLLYTEEDRARDWAEHNLEEARKHGSYNEERLRSKQDGSTFTADVDLHAIYGDDGKLRGYSMVLRDITERLAAQNENERLARELKEANERQWLFISDVLRNVSEGKLRLCRTFDDLPAQLPQCGPPIPLTRDYGLRELRHSAETAARQCNFDDARTQDIVTAVGEAAMNAISHAGGGYGRVCANSNQVQVWIEDKGQGITVDSLPNATLRKGFTTAGTLGQGMKLMLQTIDRLYLLTGSLGTTVVLEQERVPEIPAWLLADEEE